MQYSYACGFSPSFAELAPPEGELAPLYFFPRRASSLYSRRKLSVEIGIGIGIGLRKLPILGGREGQDNKNKAYFSEGASSSPLLARSPGARARLLFYFFFLRKLKNY